MDWRPVICAQRTSLARPELGDISCHMIQLGLRYRYPAFLAPKFIRAP